LWENGRLVGLVFGGGTVSSSRTTLCRLESKILVSMSRRPKISQMLSSGRTGSPIFYIIIGMGGAGLGGSGLDDGVILGLGWSHSRSQRSTLDIFPVGNVTPK